MNVDYDDSINRCDCGWALPEIAVFATGKYSMPFQSGDTHSVITCPYCKSRHVSHDQGRNWTVQK